MSFGDTTIWAGKFKRLEDRLLERILAVWPSAISVLPEQPDENNITINLVDRLCIDTQVREICFIEYQYEPFGTRSSGAKYSKGEIDFVVFLNCTCNRDQYLAYECKRLNVKNQNVRRSLATQYVDEGMSRFIKEQYAEFLSVGCMLGYVIDNDLSFAHKEVQAVINNKKTAICLQSGPSDIQTDLLIKRFTTDHMRPSSKRPIELRHTLIPLNYGLHDKR